MWVTLRHNLQTGPPIGTVELQEDSGHSWRAEHVRMRRQGR